MRKKEGEGCFPFQLCDAPTSKWQEHTASLPREYLASMERKHTRASRVPGSCHLGAPQPARTHPWLPSSSLEAPEPREHTPGTRESSRGGKDTALQPCQDGRQTFTKQNRTKLPQTGSGVPNRRVLGRGTPEPSRGPKRAAEIRQAKHFALFFVCFLHSS